MCVAETQCPNPDSRLYWGPEESSSQGNPESPARSCAREWNVLLWVLMLKQTQPRKGGRWELAEWGELYHKAASVPLEAEPTSSGQGVGRPLLLAQCSEAPGARGAGRTGEADSQGSCSPKFLL